MSSAVLAASTAQRASTASETAHQAGRNEQMYSQMQSSTVMVKPLFPATSNDDPDSIARVSVPPSRTHLAIAGDDFHALGGGGAEVIFPG
jgi:hypothetical protein